MNTELEGILAKATDSQRRYVLARLTLDPAPAMRSIGLNDKTRFTWANKEDLERAARLLQMDAIEAARLKLGELALKAVAALEDALGVGSSRVAAANSILDRIGLPATQKREISGPDGGPIAVKGYINVSPDDWKSETK